MKRRHQRVFLLLEHSQNSQRTSSIVVVAAVNFASVVAAIGTILLLGTTTTTTSFIRSIIPRIIHPSSLGRGSSVGFVAAWTPRPLFLNTSKQQQHQQHPSRSQSSITTPWLTRNFNTAAAVAHNRGGDRSDSSSEKHPNHGGASSINSCNSRRSMATTNHDQEEATSTIPNNENTNHNGNDPTSSFRDFVSARVVNSWTAQLSPETPDNEQKSWQAIAGSGGQSPKDTTNNKTNRTPRPIYNGHFVPVVPLGLPRPRLVLVSSDVLSSNVLGWSPPLTIPLDPLRKKDDDNESSKDGTDDNQQWLTEFVDFCAGNWVAPSPDNNSTTTTTTVSSWATPYALSIMGTRYTNNCPYGTGDGYGDGRAIAIGEFVNVNDNNSRWELQLKGAGPTPFGRGADGRAVLRSSIREFLASEAMHHLGVSTTRALSLVVSETEVVRRPWYSDAKEEDSEDDTLLRRPTRRSPTIPNMDDPRLAQYDEEKRREIILQLRRQYKSDPDVMGTEPAAIACRVARSFLRIGHLDLFARRATKPASRNAAATPKSSSSSSSSSLYDTSTLAWQELESLFWHACFREFPNTAHTPYYPVRDIDKAASVFLAESADGVATMVAQWIRVGFCQGNFNADNCLVAGRTMDYGPFGFMDEFDPLFAKWTGSGQHFGFMNQPNAGYANYGILVESVVPLIAVARGFESKKQVDELQKELLDAAVTTFQTKLDQAMRIKLGFDPSHDVADELWEQLEPLMQASRVDWTLFFRELSYLVRDMPHIFAVAATDADSDENVASYDEALTKLIGDDSACPGSSPFYEALTPSQRSQWLVWIESWIKALSLASVSSSDQSSSSSSTFWNTVVHRMLETANPKYVLREWMLVDAYQGAAQGDERKIRELQELTQSPYAEGTSVQSKRFYRRTPDSALTAGGTAFMS